MRHSPRNADGSAAMKIHPKSRRSLVGALKAVVCALPLLSLSHAGGQVTLKATQLCAIATCPFAPPVLKSLDSASVVSPGGKVVLQGVNFNSDGLPGQIVLKLGSKVPMTVLHLGNTGPSVYHQPYVER